MSGSFLKKSKSEAQAGLDNDSTTMKEKGGNGAPKEERKSEKNRLIPLARLPMHMLERIALAAILLLFISGLFNVWSYSRYHEMSTIMRMELGKREVVLDSLEDIKVGLVQHLEELDLTFGDLRMENDTLANWLAATTEVLAKKEALILEIKSQKVRSETVLRDQVQKLKSVVDQYETIIQVLDRRDETLIAEYNRLKSVTDSLNQEINYLGRRLEAQIRRTLSAQYKATGFRVELEQRKDKLTTRAKRTRELNIYFELNQVPRNFQGSQKLYLTITDDLGRPISCEAPIEVSIPTDRGPVAIVAQAAQVHNVTDKQQIEMVYKLEERLKKGTYVAAVYSDKGPLGAASFRLN
jgi:hypothetical protein